MCPWKKLHGVKMKLLKLASLGVQDKLGARVAISERITTRHLHGGLFHFWTSDGQLSELGDLAARWLAFAGTPTKATSPTAIPGWHDAGPRCVTQPN